MGEGLISAAGISFRMLSLSDGEFLVRLARKAISEYLEKGEKIDAKAPKHLMEPRGVFVTLAEYPSHELRGCIGYPRPHEPLADAIISMAIEAATGDPRFPPLGKEELGKTIIEVSVLTVPEPVEVKDRKKLAEEVRVGMDGLIVEAGWQSGLLLPQVPVEQKWGSEEFLCQSCWKAGLPPDSWLKPGVKILRFQAQIFAEESPGGRIEEKKL